MIEFAAVINDIFNDDVTPHPGKLKILVSKGQTDRRILDSAVFSILTNLDSKVFSFFTKI
jgi:hypothetical protein